MYFNKCVDLDGDIYHSFSVNYLNLSENTLLSSLLFKSDHIQKDGYVSIDLHYSVEDKEDDWKYTKKRGGEDQLLLQQLFKSLENSSTVKYYNNFALLYNFFFKYITKFDSKYVKLDVGYYSVFRKILESITLAIKEYLGNLNVKYSSQNK